MVHLERGNEMTETIKDRVDAAKYAKAFKLGLKAWHDYGVRGTRAAKNPYKMFSLESTIWLQGFSSGEIIYRAERGGDWRTR